MFVAGNFLSALAQVLDMALTVYMWIVIIRALISWVNPDPYNPIVRFLVSATEPVLQAHPAAGADVQNRDRPVAADRDPGDLFPEFFLVRTLIDLSYRIR